MSLRAWIQSFEFTQRARSADSTNQTADFCILGRSFAKHLWESQEKVLTSASAEVGRQDKLQIPAAKDAFIKKTNQTADKSILGRFRDWKYCLSKVQLFSWQLHPWLNISKIQVRLRISHAKDAILKRESKLQISTDPRMERLPPKLQPFAENYILGSALIRSLDSLFRIASLAWEFRSLACLFEKFSQGCNCQLNNSTLKRQSL